MENKKLKFMTVGGALAFVITLLNCILKDI